jgi:hypothetical protein
LLVSTSKLSYLSYGNIELGNNGTENFIVTTSLHIDKFMELLYYVICSKEQYKYANLEEILRYYSQRGITNLHSHAINPPSIDAARNPRIYPNVGDKIYQGLLPYANVVKPANPRGHMLGRFSKPSYQGLE